MVCEDCGSLITDTQDTCSYCGRYYKEVASFKKQKRLLILLWSFVVFIGSLAAFTFYGETILHFFSKLTEKIEVFSLLFLNFLK